MPDTDSLAGDLRSYFAATTAVQLPGRVQRLDARTLSARRSRLGLLVAATSGAIATAAILLVAATHLVPHGTATSGSYAGLATAGSSVAQAPSALATVSYPGVDTKMLAAAGVQLLAPPETHGAALIAPDRARSVAVAALGGRTGTAGPAVLTSARLLDRAPATSCLCWVVDVAVDGGVPASPGAPALRTELVLVDAHDGRVVAVVTGHGIP